MTLPVIKTWVAYLEQTTAPAQEPQPLRGFTLKLLKTPDVDFYINLYRDIGRDYIWNYRPSQSLEEIEALIQSEDTALYVLYEGEIAIGMAECDVSDPQNFEIVHFGLIPQYVDKGIGKLFLNNIVFLLWARNPRRLFLSTCGMDHEKAVSFYENAGFKVFKKKDDVAFVDYRFGDFYDMNDAPQIPHGTLI